MLQAQVLSQAGQEIGKTSAKVVDALNQPVIGRVWRTDETRIKETARGQVLETERQETNVSLRAWEIGIGLGTLAIGYWFFTGGPQKTAAALTSGATGSISSIFESAAAVLKLL